MAKEQLAEIQPSEWSERHARHLLNRAGFGAPFELVGRLAHMTPQQAVSHLVDYDRIPESSGQPDFLFPPVGPEESEHYIRGLSQDQLAQASTAVNELRRETNELLKAWWLDRMIRTRRPLQEKAALFWHGHFATSAQKVESPWFNAHLLNIFRENAVGDLRRLTFRVGRSPAMLTYLDNRINVKNGPNENWARELLELFTLGHGHYTESDIKNGARAFTGWTCDHEKFIFDENQHDDGIKTFLGKTGRFDGWDIIRIIFDHPQSARYFAHELWTYFACDDPEPELVNALANTLRESDYQLKPILRQLFLSRAFYSERAMGTQIKSPVQLMVQLCHDLELDPAPYPTLVEAGRALGQDLLTPPTVEGWTGGHDWINTSTLLMRYNLPVALVTAIGANGDTMNAMNSMRNEKAGGMGSSSAVRDLMNTRVDFTGVMERLLTAFPTSRRKEVADRLGFSSPTYRAWIDEWLGALGRQESFRSERLFRELDFTTAQDCVRALEARYLSKPLDTPQRTVLTNTLGKRPDQLLRIADLTPDAMNATLHLLVSSAEYQLC